MKVLIVGDNPNVRGGVCNYTRPLFLALNDNDIETYYLYSASRLKADYRLFSKTFIEKDDSQDFKNLYKIVNSKNLDLNYDHLYLDTNSIENDKVFKKFIEKVNPDVVHINEMIGFSSNIVNICKSKGVKVIISVHEYWWLCPKRVMVDYNRKVCEGPSNINKCTYCIDKASVGYSSKNRKKSYLINNYVRKYNLQWVKDKITTTNNRKVDKDVDLNFGGEGFELKDEFLTPLVNRLSSNIESLNKSDLILCVSEDVKNHLVKYGVLESKLLVNHIGSMIAENKIEHKKNINPELISFGFIGGVSYYKGVHQLISAYSLLHKDEIDKSELHIYGSGSPDYINAIDELINNLELKNKVFLHGRFEHKDLESITNSLDISILPSLCADTAPQTIFESFSCGLPVIGPSIGGFSDFIKHNVNGLIFEGASVESLSSAMSKVIADPELINKFKSRLTSPKKMDEHLKEIIELYENT